MTTRDQQRVRAALAGSESAYADIVKRYQRPVFSVIVRMVRDRGIAEDLTQETFIKAFRALHTFDQGKKLSSWLFSIAHNATIDHLRKKTLETVALETADDEPDPLSRMSAAAAETPERVAMGWDLARVFEDELQCLRPEYAEILVLRFQEGLTYEEIAEITGLPMGTVKTHLFRARKALAERLARRGLAP